MIAGAAAWRLLGIAPGSDAPAIRRAYAERLRAMDVDADPDGFARLRAARDAALALARGVPLTDDPQEAPPAVDSDGDVRLPANLSLARPIVDGSTGASLTTTVAPAPPLARVTPPVAPGASRAIPLDAARLLFIATLRDGGAGDLVVRPARGDVLATHFHRLEALLDPASSDEALSEDECDEAQAALAALLADPRLDDLTFRADAEGWFAETLARAVPRADPLLRMAADTFGWAGSGSLLHTPPAVAFIAERLAAEDFAADVARPGHPYHAAWRVLTDGDHNRRHRFGASRRRQRALLAQIRQHHPVAEAWLDPYRVAQVDEGVVIAGPPIWIWAVILPMLLRFATGFYEGAMPGFEPPPPVARLADASTPSFTPQPVHARLTDRNGDMTAVLAGFGPAYDAQRVKRENPALYRALSKRWERARDRDLDRDRFIDNERRELADRADRSVRHAPWQTVRDWRQLERDALAATAARKGMARCRDPLADQALLERRAALALAIVVADPVVTRPYRMSWRFSIPGKVVREVGAAAGLDGEPLKDALSGDATPEAACRVRIALLDAALKLSKAEGLKLLRTM